MHTKEEIFNFFLKKPKSNPEKTNSFDISLRVLVEKSSYTVS